MRTTSKSTSQTPSESQAREALSQYITHHLAIETQETKAKKDIELIKEAVAIACKPLVEGKAYAESILMAYAEAHPEFFKERRKTELWGGHKIGYQTSPPAVVLVRLPGGKKKQTWSGFVAACKRLGAGGYAWIRTSEEPDKEALLGFWRTLQAVADAKQDVTLLKGIESDLARLGVAIAQEERFVIDLNLQPEAQS